MSEASQGEGWWQASDLKWYPPESRTERPPPVSGLKRLRSVLRAGVARRSDLVGRFWWALATGLLAAALLAGCGGDGDTDAVSTDRTADEGSADTASSESEADEGDEGSGDAGEADEGDEGSGEAGEADEGDDGSGDGAGATEALAEYLIAVLESDGAAGVSDAVSAVPVTNTSAAVVQYNRDVAAATGRQLAILTELQPPAEAVAFHGSLLDVTSRGAALNSALADALANNEATDPFVADLTTLAEDALAMVAEQQRLTEVVLSSRSDPLSVYLLASQSVPIGDLQALLSDLGEAFEVGDFEDVVSILQRESALFGDVVDELESLDPPEVAQALHNLRIEQLRATRGALDRMLASIENADSAELDAAVEDMVASVGGFGELQSQQTDLLVTALRGP